MGKYDWDYMVILLSTNENEHSKGRTYIASLITECPKTLLLFWMPPSLVVQAPQVSLSFSFSPIKITIYQAFYLKYITSLE